MMNPRSSSVSNQHQHHHHHQNYSPHQQQHRHKMIDSNHLNNNNDQFNDDDISTRIVKCSLNEDQCLSLDDILRSFQTSINEEQAWALCYQIVKCFRQYYQSHINASQYCYLITDPAHVLIHKDGHVHPKTLHQKTIQGTSRTLAKSSHKLLTSLGIVLFHALDYGLCEDEERTLSKPLELLIERLTTAHELACRQKKTSSSSSSTTSNNTATTANMVPVAVSATMMTTGASITTTTSSSTTVQSSCSSSNANNNVKVNNDQMNSIGSMCYEDENGADDHPEDDEDDDDDDVDVADDEDEDECANADEGIERDCHEYGDHHSNRRHSNSSFNSNNNNNGQTSSTLLNFDQVMQMCVSRLSSRESADNHYKAVCRALLAETLELSTFLDQISKGTKELKKSSVLTIESNINNDSQATLEKLQFHDWARLWIQVIRELRHGVKLKKVDQEDIIHNTEYELTPYEMLLDDIRSRRYKLNKVMVNGDLPPRVKKDAHELILDFIRSRPPLVPVSQRVLKPPPPKQVTLYEKLMESIRQEHKLRPTPKPMKTYSFSAHVTPIHHPETIDEDEDGGVSKFRETERNNSITSFSSNSDYNNRRPSTSKKKKVIKADIQLDLFSDDEDEERILSIQVPSVRREKSSRTTRPMSAYFPSEMDFNYLNELEDDIATTTNHEMNDTVKNDDANNLKENTDNTSTTSISSSRTILRLKKLSSQFFSKERRHSISVCDLKALEQKQKQQEQIDRDLIEDLDFNEDARNHVASIWEQNDFGKSLECLSLTLKEVQHIRSVLTKAEIESLGVTKTLKKDLENGKICFTCLKTKFTFWGPWATICKLCNRAICDRCATKMHIPTEQFDRVPIYMLSPTPSPPNERHVLDIFKFADSNCNNQQNKTSSTSMRKQETMDTNESKSLPPKLNTSRNRMMRLVRMLTTAATTSMSNDVSDDNDVDDHHHYDPPNEQTDDNSHNNHQQETIRKSSGPLVKVCRDCKILVRHLIDIGHTNFNGGKIQNPKK